MIETLRLFTSPSVFPNPQRVRLLIHEKGIADRIEEVLLDMAPAWKNSRQSPEFFQLP